MRRLFEQDGLRFSQMNVRKLPTDQFSYHLRQLQRAKLVEKLPDQTYRLTARGKLKAILLKPEGNEFIEQGFTAAVVVVTKEENGQKLFLVQERDKVPFKGLAAPPGDKVYYGESTQQAAERALLLQTGLKGGLELRAIWHIRDIHAEEVVQDKYFYVYFTDQFEGQVKPTGITGSNRWVTYDDILHSKGMIPSAIDITTSVLSKDLTYHEKTYTVENY